MKKEIQTGAAVIGPYSVGIEHGNMLYTSGQLGFDASGNMVSEDVREQAVQVMENLKTILTSAGYTFDHAVKCLIFLTDLADFATVNTVYESYLAKPYPARSCVQVAALPKGGKVEIELVAIK